MRKYTIAGIILFMALGNIQDAQAMAQGFFSSMKKLAIVVTPLVYYVQKKENEDWIDYLIQDRNEPKDLTVNEKNAFEERFSLVKKYDVFFTQRPKEKGPIGVYYNSLGKVLVSINSDFLLLPEQMKIGIRAHEASHVELMHFNQKEKEKKIKTIAMSAHGLILLKLIQLKKLRGFILTLSLLPAYYYFPALRSQMMEKEADLYNKTPEELYGLLLYFYALNLGSKEENWFKKLSSSHPSHRERYFYILEALKKQISNPGSRDTPLTEEALVNALFVYLKSYEIEQLLLAEDFDATWESLKINHIDCIKERIFFLCEEYMKCIEKG
jgi:hypothetical protein